MSDTSVYVIGTVRDGKIVAPCKIGISAQPSARVWALQTACPYELQLVSEHPLPSRDIALQIEECFHHTQHRHRLRGEWFDLDPQQAANILKLQIRWAIQAFTDLAGEDLELAYSLSRTEA